MGPSRPAGASSKQIEAEATTVASACPLVTILILAPLAGYPEALGESTRSTTRLWLQPDRVSRPILPPSEKSSVGLALIPAVDILGIF